MYTPTGIIHIVGEPDTGKTLLALGAYHPSKTAYFFDDVKRPPIPDKEFGLFVDLIGQYHNLKMLEYYKAVKAYVSSIPENKYDAIIFDTWARFGKAIRYYAKANPTEFRESSTFSANGIIRNMEQWGETHAVEATVISELSRKCKALFLITHIKPKIVAGASTGTYEPDCGKSFDKVCNLRLWLRHNEHSAVPIALVLKRISKVEITKTGVEIMNVLPRRIAPLPDDKSVWQVIDRYWQAPVGNNEPTEAEKPTPFELSILDGVLTEDQKQVWQAELKEKARQEQDILIAQDELIAVRVKELQAESMSLAQIVAAVNAEFGQNYSIGEIAGRMK